MNPFYSKLAQDAAQNANFRKVLYTTPQAQLVVMSLQPKEDIGQEIHDVAQFIRVESGEGIAVLEGREQTLGAGDCVFIPAGTKHNIINASEREEMKLSTLYAPPEHKDGTIHVTKAYAQAHEEHYEREEK